MDRFDRPASPAEIGAMRRTLETSLEHGAIGMSTGLYYPPANAAPTDEVIALVSSMRAYGGIHTTHMRDEASHIVASVNETIAIGKAADVPVVISHHKASGTPNHGLVKDTLKLIDEARKHQKLGLDVYPYVAGLHHARSAAAWRSPARSSSPGRRHGRNSPARRSTPSRSNSAATSRRPRTSCCPPARSIS